jgi:Tol biopolymer transport system component
MKMVEERTMTIYLKAAFVLLFASIILSMMSINISADSVLPPDDIDDFSPNVSLRGFRGQDMIAYYTKKSGNIDIYLMNADGSCNIRLTDHPADDLCAGWSPDGTKIAFESDRDGNVEIYVMNTDGSNLHRLTNNPGEDYHHDWSPDGSKIAFMSEVNGNKDIYVMDADGSNVVRLTYDPAIDMRPDWFADGERLVFNSERDGYWEVYSINADGTDLTNITNTPLVGEVFPRLSPDNTKIVYFNYPGGGDLYVMNIDGTDVTQLTTHPAVDESPCWSPDGTQIAFQSSRSGNFEIYVMNTDGSNQTRLTFNYPGDFWPDWSPRVDELVCDHSEVSAALGGEVRFSLLAGLINSKREYLLLGSTSGTSPGYPLPGGYAVLPLNWDAFTAAICTGINLPVFSDFLGLLDITSRRQAFLNIPPLSPAFIGTEMHFAYTLGDPFDFVSNPVLIEIAP